MKADLLELIRAELRRRLERLTRAAQATHAAATDPDSKAESKYDTRNLEAGYLASGQARQVRELTRELEIFENCSPPPFETGAAIESGALVEGEIQGQTMRFLLLPVAGGMEIMHDANEVTVLSPASALYQKLLGLRAGDRLQQPRAVIRKVS